MFKKLLIVLFLFSVFFVGNSFAEYKYVQKHDVKADTVKQTEIKKYLASWHKIDYDAVRKELKEPNMSDEYIDANVEDWLEWDITRAVKVVYDRKVEEDIKKLWINTDSGKKVDKSKNEKCKFDLEWSGKYDWNVRHAIEECITGSSLVQPNVKLDVVSGGLKEILNGWIQKIAGFLALWAIFAIAFGSLKLTLSMWEEEKIKKAKDIIKWWVIGFIAVISAWFFIAVLVNLIYSLAG